MIRRPVTTALAGIALGLLGPLVLPVAPSGAEESHSQQRYNYCTIAGSIASTPGLTYEARATTYDVNGTMDCSSDEPMHGTMSGTGKGTTGCFGGSSTALLKIAWDNGTVSTIDAQLGDFGYGTGGQGSVTDGTFKGSHFGLGWGREAAAAEYRCANSEVKSYQFAGYVYFHQHDNAGH